MIGLSPTQVKIWFQNHRYKAKKGEKDRNDSEGMQAGMTGRGQPRHLLGLTPLSHVNAERTLLAQDDLPPSSRMSLAASLHVNNEVGSRKTTGTMAGSDDIADNISEISSTVVATQKTEVAAATTGLVDSGAKYFQSDGASTTVSYFIPSAASSNTEPDSTVKLSSMQNWAPFSDQFARLQQQQQNGSGTSLTELKPIYIAGLGSAAASASSASNAEAQSLAAIAGARGGAGGSGYFSVSPGSFGFPPSYYGSAYTSYMEPTTSSHAFLADTDRTW